ncbi:MAG: hypothetical protein M3Z45_04100 [Bombilactobacillus mellifer]|uniref:hypothetical protein n=1 Tax=Bombilactobacillus mellifer TaxID=1218492 RepID=UPI0018DD6256|nr:hypothetical protein [Bombilactobacillus mellifer]MBH9991194.1 hypothetical protein [Lactobacillus sp. W8092]MCT6826849.1 hypothetical protein [Bombilactobacillus mellifer]MCT6844298.1 hypothetical protein [Bombilactobacillus mellifer]MCT6894601.1 hypothetical protein [Bombilactobacillus mellifer]
MKFIIAFIVVMLFMLIGEWVSSISHAYIPSVFITAVLFAIGFWTILPKNIVADASYGKAFVAICVSMLLVHLGTLMSLKELIAQWKAVCIALLGVAGTLVLCLTIGTLIFDWHTVVAAIPPLTGGVVSAVLMTSGLKAQGATALIALPVSMFVLHSVLGYPLTSYMLRTEGRRLVKEFNDNGRHLPKEAAAANNMDTGADDTSTGVFHLPAEFQTSAFILVRVAAVALFSNWIAGFVHINANVLCLVFGVLAHQFGFLESSALNKAGVFNWLMYGLLAYVFSQLNMTSPAIIGSIIGKIIVLIALGLLGMFLASWLLAKPFGMTWHMAYACSLTSLFGFPADYILTSEIARTMANDKEEESYLLYHMMPKMLVGGFATVSVASVIIASIFLKLI